MDGSLCSVIGKCDWRSVGDFLGWQVCEELQERLVEAFGDDMGFKEISEDIIVPLLLFQVDSLLKNALIHTFGPKP